MKLCLQSIAQCLIHEKYSILLGILTLIRQDPNTRGLIGHFKDCGLYPRNNGKPLKTSEQGGNLIDNV